MVKNSESVPKGEQMPKLNLETDKIPDIALSYMKRAEEENRIRAAKFIASRRRANFIGITLGLAAIGIYSYTLLAVKQETFLDDFEEPPKIIKSQQ